MIGCGYASTGYAAALSFHGQPLELPRCGGWLLRRVIPDCSAQDVCGGYPIFSCRDWSLLGEDLEDLPSNLISVTMVVDPFASITASQLAQAFPDRCVPFKTHFVRDLSTSERVTSHHRRNIRVAAAQLEVELCARPMEHLDDWCRLYDNLVARCAITGVAAFSCASFAAQLAMPDLRAYRAVREGRTVGMVLWLLGAETVYYHLAAYDAEGYRSKAAFALFDAAIAAFRLAGFRWLALGGAAGASVTVGEGDGLTRFKKGWATGTRVARIGGRILDAKTYQRLAGADPSAFFPAYRDPSRTLPCT